MKLNLENKIALVTGGSKGIGKAICGALEKEGVIVKSLSRTEGYDLMREEYLNKAKILTKYCNILINNIGGGGTWKQEYYNEVMKKNYGIMVELISSYLDKPRKWGRVITISSIYGTYPGDNPYFAASKSAQIMFNKSIAHKYKGITFNCVSPSEVSDAGFYKDVDLKSQDVANLVTFLCSNKAKFINGENIVLK